MVRNIRWMGLALICALGLSGCGSKEEAAVMQEVPKPIKILVLEEQTLDKTLDYIGVVGTNPTYNPAFKTGGKLASIEVTKGQEVTKGMILATLDTQEMQLGVDAARAQLAAANAQYEKADDGATQEELNNAQLNVDKAQKAYDHMNAQYEKMTVLLAEGVVAQNELDQLALQRDVQEMTLRQAREVYLQAQKGAADSDLKALRAQIDQAKINLEAKEIMVRDSELISDVDGIVLDVLYDAGELIGSGYPVVVIGTREQVVKVGIIGEDLGEITVGTTAKLPDGSGAAVRYISDIPDSSTLTYVAELPIDDGRFNLGEILDIRFAVGKSKGIWIPLNTVLSQGKDFVMIESGGRAVKTEIAIEESRGTQVRASGLNVGDHLIVEGIHKINDGDSVLVGE